MATKHQALAHVSEIEPPPKPQTWAAHVFVPLAQNVLGGVAVAGLYAIVSTALARLSGSMPDVAAVTLWGGLAGATVTCIATITRFFADDLGILQAAYRQGRHSMELRVNALEIELQAAKVQLAKARRHTGSVPRTKAQQQMQQVKLDAIQLLNWHFGGLPIDRRSCEQRNMPQGAWRRARHLLITAGVMDEKGVTSPTTSEALQVVNDHYEKLVLTSGQSAKFVSPV